MLHDNLVYRLNEIGQQLDRLYRWRHMFDPYRLQKAQALRWEARSIRETIAAGLTSTATPTSGAFTCAT
jgi:hypothetical protein